MGRHKRTISRGLAYEERTPDGAELARRALGIHSLFSRIAAVSGMATDPGVLIQAHIQHARLLVLSPMDILDIHKIVDIAKTLNPEIQVLVCAESKEEAEVIRRDQIGEVYFAKEEMAKNMSNHILNQIQIAHHQAPTH